MSLLHSCSAQGSSASFVGFFWGVEGGISVGAITKSPDHKSTMEAMNMVLQLVIIFQEGYQKTGESNNKYNQRSKITKIKKRGVV